MFDKIEDWFLSLSFVEDKWPQECYFTLCRFFTMMKDTLWYGPRSFIGNIIKYKKFLWSDRWFDHYYLFNVLKIKLESDSKSYRKYGMCVDADKLADEMDKCISFLNKIIKDEYEEEALKDHDLKWGKLDFNFEKCKGGSLLNRYRSNVLTKNDEEQERKEFMDYMSIADLNRKNDIKDLFEMISDNILKWWD